MASGYKFVKVQNKVEYEEESDDSIESKSSVKDLNWFKKHTQAHPNAIQKAKAKLAEMESSPNEPPVEALVSITDDRGLQEDFKKLLICPACTNLAVPPIFLCARGHIICTLCKEKLELCPSCHSSFSTIRSELAESMLAKFSFQCIYREDGYKEIFMGADLKDHLNQCPYRDVPCPYVEYDKSQACEAPINYQRFLNHLKKEHKVETYTGESGCYSMSTSKPLGQKNFAFPPIAIEAFGEIFFCHFHAAYNLIIAWVSVFGAKAKQGKYYASITMIHPDKTSVKTTWMCKVHSFRQNAKDIFDSGKCLILFPETFLQFASSIPSH